MRKININKKLSAVKLVDFCKLRKLICYYLLVSFLVGIFSSSCASIEITGGDTPKATEPPTTDEKTDESSNDIKTTSDKTGTSSPDTTEKDTNK
jgi:hypothetical protein